MKRKTGPTLNLKPPTDEIMEITESPLKRPLLTERPPRAPREVTTDMEILILLPQGAHYNEPIRKIRYVSHTHKTRPLRAPIKRPLRVPREGTTDMEILRLMEQGAHYNEPIRKIRYVSDSDKTRCRRRI